MTISQHTIDTPYPVGPVHCYTLERVDELILFDTGPPTETARRYLQEHLDLSRLTHLVITHCHVDHYGLAHWLAETTGARVWLPYRDSLKLRHHQRRLSLLYGLLAEIGFGADFLADLERVFVRGNLFPPVPAQWSIAEEGLAATLGIEAIPCPSHSQSDLVYCQDDWAVTGDTLLQGIFQTPLLDVDLETGERFSNYRAYCSSIVKLASLSGRRVLPGHRESIESVEDVLFFYVSKLLSRAGKLLNQPGAEYRNKENIAGLVQQFGGSLARDPFYVYVKASELVFMKDFLADPGRLRRALETIGLFDRVAPLFAGVVE